MTTPGGSIPFRYLGQNVVMGPQGGLGRSGAQGPQGISGKSGFQGVPGAGFSGTQGASGLSGVQGATGPRGFQGETGVQGDIGLSGTSGSIGYSGALGPQGLEGISGKSGVRGEIGVQGPQGTQGIIGLSGQSGAQGFSGQMGAQGLSGQLGSQGLQGTQGITGTQGFSGESGAQGFSGELGVQGNQGTQGDIGESGESGAQGFSGESGAQGFSGELGLSGTSGIQGAFGGLSLDFQFSTDLPVDRQVWLCADDGGGRSGISSFADANRIVFGDNTTNPLINDWIESFDETTSAAKGQVKVFALGDQTNWAMYRLTSDIAWDAGDSVWVGPVSYIADSGSFFTDDSQVVVAPSLKGDSGTSGRSGRSGYSGRSGFQGFSGTSGASGDIPGSFRFIYNNTTSAPPDLQQIRMDNATLANVTSLYISDYESDESTNVSNWLLSIGSAGTTGWHGWAYVSRVGRPDIYAQYVVVGIEDKSGYVTLEVINQSYSVASFTHTEKLVVTLVPAGTSGYSGLQGFQGDSGTSGYQGYSGTSGYQGDSGTSGYQGDSGTSGYQGFQGDSGTSGYQGYSGTSGQPPLAQIWYLDDTASGIGSYKYLSKTVPSATPASISRTLKNTDGEVLLYGFITDEMNLTSLPQGLREFDTYLSVDDTGDISDCVIRAYKRTSVGLETEIYDLTISPITHTTAMLQTGSFTSFSSIDINPTDRIIIKYFAKTASTSNRVITLYYQDATESLVVTPVPLYGVSGVSGTSGTSGYQGAQGPSDGDSGVSGAQGLQGDSGTSGYQGDSGTSGYQGDSGESGCQGPQGESGTSGYQGSSGTSGYQGDSGTSGYQGDSGASGYQGTQGETGDSGAQGFSGTSGYQGDSGTSGYQGAQGPSDGDSGVSGCSGASGFDGVYIGTRSIPSTPTQYIEIGKIDCVSGGSAGILTVSVDAWMSSPAEFLLSIVKQYVIITHDYETSGNWYKLEPTQSTNTHPDSYDFDVEINVDSITYNTQVVYYRIRSIQDDFTSGLSACVHYINQSPNTNVFTPMTGTGTDANTLPTKTCLVGTSGTSGFSGFGTSGTSGASGLASSQFAVLSKTADYSIAASDSVILVSGIATDLAMTLPAAGGAGVSGRQYVLKNIGTSNVWIGASGSEIVDGSSGFAINNQYDAATVISDGSQWHVI